MSRRDESREIGDEKVRFLVRVSLAKVCANVRKVTAWLGLLAGVSCLAAAGCATAEKAPSPATMQVTVPETESARKLDEKEAARLKLQAEYRQGISLYAAGRTDEAMNVLRAVAEKCAEQGVALPPAQQTRLEGILSGAPPASPPAPGVERPNVRPAPPTGPILATPRPPPATPQQVPPKPGSAAPPPIAENEVHLPALKNAAMADQLISVDFAGADIRLVIKTIGDLTGQNFLVDDSVKGTVTLMAPTKVRLGDVYKVLESILDLKGFAAIPSGNVVKIMQRTDAVKRSIAARFGNDPAAIPQSDTIVTQIIPLSYASAADVSTVVTPLLGSAEVKTYPQTNVLVVTDTESNIRRVLEILRQLDLPTAEEVITVIPLVHAKCTSITDQLLQIMEKRSGGSSPAGASSATGASTAARGAGANAAPAPQSGGGATKSAGVTIIPDARTNSIVVVATARLTESIRELVAQLDVQRPLDVGNIHVIYLENAEAKDVAKSLQGALDAASKASGEKAATQVNVTADDSTNSLILISSPEDYKVVADIVSKLDVTREQVLVELRIIEVSQDVLNQIGVEWASLDAPTTGLTEFGGTNFGLTSQLTAGTLQGLSVGAEKLVAGSAKIGALLTLLETRTDVNILSTPQILTTNHHEAKINVTENIPYISQGQVSSVEPSAPTVINTYSYKDVGVILKLTPHISHGGMVRLVLDSTYSTVVPTANAPVGTITTETREAETVVTMRNGATIVLGGLISDTKTLQLLKVPIVGDIPLLGVLFRYRSFEDQKTNLLLFITPYVLTSQPDVAAAPAPQQSDAHVAAPAPQAGAPLERAISARQ